MACIYNEHDTLPVAEIRLVGRLTENDMNHIVPKLEAFITKHGKIRLIEIIERFEGLDPTTVLDGMKFDMKHLSDVTHAAVVSDMAWIGFMTRAAAAMMPLTVRVFGMDQIDEARDWIANPEPPSSSST